MKFIIRWLQRLVIAMAAVIAIWLIATQVYERLDNRLPAFVALLVTYFISAYVILPIIIHLTIMISRKGRIPRFTMATDGFYVDPVNIILIGSKDELQNVFKKIGWNRPDSITIKSILKMIRAFIFKKSYPRAPFSYLFLFGRKQDIGFQESIDNNPRKRHHIRFWATDANKISDPLDIKYWTKKQKINRDKAVIWIGAASEDVGLGFKKLTYQVTHKVDPNVDEERDYLLNKLKKAKCIEKIDYYNPGKFKVGKYVSDGRIAVAKLKS